MAFVLRFLAVVLFLCLTPVAGAAPTDSEGVPARVGPEKQYLDYRPALILTDVAALGLFATAIAWGDGPQTEIAYAGAGVYVLGGPIVHLAHGQPKLSLASLVMRAGVPVAGFGVGFVLGLVACPATPVHGEGCIALGATVGVVGFIAGGVAAIVVDDAFLGKVKIEESASSGRKATRAGIASIVPVVDPKRKVLGLSLVGLF